MSYLIRAYGITMSDGGVCRKCSKPRDEGDHEKCDRWPGTGSFHRGFRYIGNSSTTNIGELKRLVEVVCRDEPDDTPVQFELRVRQRETAPGKRRETAPKEPV